jgi:NitT/TauT family transport system ATP-binding protein
VSLQHPRNRLDPEFRQLVDRIYALMTKRPEPAAPGRDGTFPGLGVAMALPQVSTNTLAGMIEEIAADPYNGRADLPALADSLQLEIDELFPVAETLQLLRFAELEEGDIKLTPAGARFADLETDARKKLFGDHLLSYLPLAARIKSVLEERPTHTARATRFREELEDHMSEEYAERTLKSVITWGRYGEVFAYDETSETLSLENPQ